MTGVEKHARFAIRTVKNGAVKINGRTYLPKRPAYDGSLDGHRFAFGLYRGRPDIASLWGTEAAYRAEGDEYERIWATGPHCVDGVFLWEWWESVT